MKQARGLPLDTEGACPLCNAERLQHELGVRHGQDLTSALRRIKEVSEETYALALERLDRFVSADVMEDFKGRVTRAKHRKHWQQPRRRSGRPRRRQGPRG